MKTLIIALFIFVGLTACTKNPTSLPSAGAGPIAEKVDAIYPHADGWVTTHGIQYLNNASACTTCHGANLDGGRARVSCNKCHSSYPHTPFWAKPENHGAAFAKILTDIEAGNGDVMQNQCVTCHKAPEAGTPILSPKSAKNTLCNSCHVGVPHDDSAMVTRDGQTVHHKVFGKARALTASCLSCHAMKADGTQKYMPNMETCTACHANKKPHTLWEPL